MKAIIYTRYSPKPGGKESESNEVQRAYCEEHATQKEWKVGEFFEDKQRSGSDDDRPGLWAAVSELEKGDVLLVWRLDRLARNLFLMEKIRHSVEKRGARIEAVEGDIEGDTAEAIFMRQIMAAFAEYERRLIARRTKAAMLMQQKNGKCVSRYAPYGYAIRQGRLVENYKEQYTIAYIERLLDDTDDTLEITRKLNASTFKTRTGRPWRRRDVERILANMKIEDD